MPPPWAYARCPPRYAPVPATDRPANASARPRPHRPLDRAARDATYRLTATAFAVACTRPSLRRSRVICDQSSQPAAIAGGALAVPTAINVVAALRPPGTRSMTAAERKAPTGTWTRTG